MGMSLFLQLFGHKGFGTNWNVDIIVGLQEKSVDHHSSDPDSEFHLP